MTFAYTLPIPTFADHTHEYWKIRFDGPINPKSIPNPSVIILIAWFMYLNRNINTMLEKIGINCEIWMQIVKFI